MNSAAGRLFILLFCLLTWTACNRGPEVAGHPGGTDDIPNALTGASGRVVDQDGHGVAGATVTWYSEGSAPVPDDIAKKDTLILITDSNGFYRDSHLTRDNYVIVIRDPSSNQAALTHCTVTGSDTLVNIGVDTLKPCGAVQCAYQGVVITGNTDTTAYRKFVVVIWNLSIVRELDKNFSFLIPSLPQGSYRLRIQSKQPSDYAMLDTQVTVRSGDTLLLDELTLFDRNRITTSDSQAVRAILDSNHYHDSLAQFMWVVNGRVVYLKFLDKDFTVIPDDIAKLDKLEYLSILGTGNTSLPALRISEKLGDLDSLKSVIMVGQRLPDVPPVLRNLRSLGWLDLSNNRIDSLPGTFFAMSDLKSLNLESNNLSVLPEAIENLALLTELKLSVNRITLLPSGIGRLTRLSNLYLDNNPLDSLPAALGRLQNLKELSLRNNGLKALPDSLSRLNCCVDVSNNRLCDVPDSMARWLNKNFRLYLNIADTTAWRPLQTCP